MLLPILSCQRSLRDNLQSIASNPWNHTRCRGQDISDNSGRGLLKIRCGHSFTTHCCLSCIDGVIYVQSYLCSLFISGTTAGALFIELSEMCGDDGLRNPLTKSCMTQRNKQTAASRSFFVYGWLCHKTWLHMSSVMKLSWFYSRRTENYIGAMTAGKII